MNELDKRLADIRKSEKEMREEIKNVQFANYFKTC